MKMMAIALSLAFGGAVVSGCATGPRVVSKAEVEADLAAIVREAGAEPERVTCRDDLVGEVGQSTECEIEVTPTEFLLAPTVTVTSVEGDTVNWEYTPALTQKQLERQMVDEAARMSGKAPDSVSCEGGLEAEKGTFTYCHFTADGVTVRRAIKVTNVDKLQISKRVLAVLPRAAAEKSLTEELIPQIGQPDAVTCAGDLDGEEGKTVECTVVAGPESQDFLLTVESVHGEQILFRYEPAD